MTIRVSDDNEALSREAARIIETAIREAPHGLYCFAAGHTPARTYGLLVEDARRGELDCGQIQCVGLDEWMGVSADAPGGCREFLSRRLFGPLGIGQSRIWFFDGLASDPAEECARTDRFLAEHGPVHLMVLGIGMNGHLGLNEPGCSEAGGSGVTRLSSMTRKVMRKYFPGDVHVEEGITLGISQLLASTSILLMASRETKARIVRKAVEGAPTNAVPASLLRHHAQCTLLLDAAAASRLSGPLQ